MYSILFVKCLQCYTEVAARMQTHTNLSSTIATHARLNRVTKLNRRCRNIASTCTTIFSYS